MELKSRLGIPGSWNYIDLLEERYSDVNIAREVLRNENKVFQ